MLNSKGFEIFGLLIVILVSLVVAAAAGYIFISENGPLGQGGIVISPPVNVITPPIVNQSQPGPPVTGIVPGAAPNGIRIWFSNATVKIHKDTASENIPPSESAVTGKISAARNEYESFQIVVSSLTSNAKKFKINISEFKAPSSSIEFNEKITQIDLYKAGFIDTSKWLKQINQIGAKTSCIDFGFQSGALGCSQNCTYDTSACSYEKIIAPPEDYSKYDIPPGFEYPTLDPPIISPGPENKCGNGTKEDWEVCEGTNLGTWKCTDFGFGSGTLKCTADCKFDVSACVLKSGQPDEKCGNKLLDAGETCEGTGWYVIPVVDDKPPEWLVDPLTPIKNGETNITVNGNENQPIWFTVYVPKKAPAGKHYATVTITFDTGEAITKVIELEVYNFALPDETTFKSLFGFYNISYHFANNTDPNYMEKYNNLVEKYFEIFKRERINPGTYGPLFLPYLASFTPQASSPDTIKYTVSAGGKVDLVPDSLVNFDAMGDKYLTTKAGERKFNTFQFVGVPWVLYQDNTEGPGLGNTDADGPKWIMLYQKAYAHIKEMGWAGKAVYYTITEMGLGGNLNNPAYVDKITRWATWVHRGAPELKTHAKVYTQSWSTSIKCDYIGPDGTNPVINTLLKAFYYNDTHVFNDDGSKPVDTWMLRSDGYGPLMPLFVKHREDTQNENFWFYDNGWLTGITMKYPNGNFYQMKGKEGAMNRVLPWILWDLGGKGLFNYATNLYYCGISSADQQMHCHNPWNNAVGAYYKDYIGNGAGDTVTYNSGSLIYPPCGKNVSGDDGIKCTTADDETIVISQRLELIREGIEDYDYFNMLRKKIDASSDPYLKNKGEEALRYAMSLVASKCYYGFDPNADNYYKARDMAGKAIAAFSEFNLPD